MINAIKISLSLQNQTRLPVSRDCFIYSNANNKELVGYVLRTINPKGGYPELDDIEVTESNAMAIIGRFTVCIVLVDKSIFENGSEFRTLILPSLQKTHIQIVPIILDEESVDLYQSLFGNAQYVLLKDEDFSNKIHNTLTSYIPLDADPSDVFRKKIFVSYRKKDICQVLDALEFIHSEASLRVVSCWFDFFINAGGDFNEEIAKNIDDCDLVVLMVTRNTFEKDNYIIRKEYPYILKTKKPVIALRLDDTSSLKIRTTFRHIKGIYDFGDKQAHKAIAKLLCLGDAQPLEDDKAYTLSKLYLNGVGVERNTLLAEKMLVELADKGYMEAIKLLAELFASGNQVERDSEKAIYWYERLDEEAKASLSPIQELEWFGLAYGRTHNIDKAIEINKKCLSIVLQEPESLDISQLIGIKVGFLDLGMLYESKGKPLEARECYLDALKVAISYNKKKGKAGIRLLDSTYDVYSRLARLFNNRLDNKKEALFYAKKAVFLFEQDKKELLNKDGVALFYSSLLEVLKDDEGVLDKLLTTLEKDDLGEISPGVKANCYWKAVKVMPLSNGFARLLAVLDKGIENAYKCSDDMNRNFLLLSFFGTKGNIYMKLGDMENALVCFDKSYFFANKDGKDVSSREAALNAVSCSWTLKQYSVCKDYLDKGILHAQRCLESKEEPVSVVYWKLAFFYLMYTFYWETKEAGNNFDMAKSTSEKAAQYADLSLEDFSRFDKGKLLFLGGVYYEKAVVSQEGRNEALLKALKLYQRLLEKYPGDKDILKAISDVVAFTNSH